MKQPWIHKPLTDSLFLLSPPFAILAVVFFCQDWLQHLEEKHSFYTWLFLVVFIDVAHVYATLFKTYLVPASFREKKRLLITLPVICFLIGMALFMLGSKVFWVTLAYVAVFHFIRQQYGFMRVYSRKEITSTSAKLIDKVAIYYATIFPVIYWHLSGPRNFNWFLDGDFYFFKAEGVLAVATAIFYIVLTVYVIKEVGLTWSTRQINLPRIGIISGTIISWYLGIVYFNGDLAFTLLNVVSHGIPYMALIYVYGNKKVTNGNADYGRMLKWIFSRYGIVLFLGIVFLFAYLEEGLWDTLVWKDHKSIFPAFYIADVEVSNTILSFVIPLLALPQVTHYIIDGFIWKIRKDEFKWNNEVNGSSSVISST